MRIYWYFNVCQENHITACRVDSTQWNDIEELSSVRRLQFFFRSKLASALRAVSNKSFLQWREADEKAGEQDGNIIRKGLVSPFYPRKSKKTLRLTITPLQCLSTLRSTPATYFRRGGLGHVRKQRKERRNRISPLMQCCVKTTSFEFSVHFRPLFHWTVLKVEPC